MVAQRWFALADLLLVAFSIVLVELAPGLGGLPLILAFLPWLARGWAGRCPFQRTRFDWLLLVFLITAAVGVWAAYAPVEAWRKFWSLAGGVFLFYALAGQPRENHWLLAWLAGLFGTASALFFLLANDWQASPAKIGLINRVGLWWMNIRPDLLPGFTPPADFADMVAGILAITVPFLFAVGAKAWMEKKIPALVGFLACGLFVGVSFMLAISRGATIALAMGLAAWTAWSVANHYKAAIVKHSPALRLGVLAIAALLLASSFLVAQDGPLALLRAGYHFYAASDRQEGAFAAVKLIGDFPYTGGGLCSFAGLYSQYILSVPYFFIANSHNLFLDVGVEQGVAGMLSVILVLIGSTRLLLTASVKTEHRLLLQAAFASLVVLVLHGLVDDIFYGSHSAFLLFSLPGIACTVSRPWPDRASKPSRAVSISLVAILAVLLLLFLLKWPVLSAAWQADLGAVQMAKIELKHFPTGSWDEQATIQDLAPVEITFQEALRRDPGQRTALMRLGRIAMERRDFSAAVSYLARARQIDPAHPGIVKSLAFSYAWNGQFDQAALLLQQVPGARQELEAYAWWWKEHGREDLAAKALEMLGRLEN